MPKAVARRLFLAFARVARFCPALRRRAGEAVVRAHSYLGQLAAIGCGGSERRGRVLLIGLDIESNRHAQTANFDLDILVQQRCLVLLVAAYYLAGSLHQRVEGGHV